MSEKIKPSETMTEKKNKNHVRNRVRKNKTENKTRLCGEYLQSRKERLTNDALTAHREVFLKS